MMPGNDFARFSIPFAKDLSPKIPRSSAMLMHLPDFGLNMPSRRLTFAMIIS
jgi:hypothetical protein